MFSYSYLPVPVAMLMRARIGVLQMREGSLLMTSRDGVVLTTNISDCKISTVGTKGGVYEFNINLA